MRYVGYATVAFFAIIAVMILAFVLGWIAVPFQVYGPNNVREQWRFAYDYDASLSAIARQDCIAIKAEETALPEEKSARTSQRIAIENNYNRVEAEYDGRLRDAFRAGRVAPSDVPQRAPSLEAAKARAGC